MYLCVPGRWSAPVPRCMPIICPTLETEDPHLTLVEHNTSYGGRAVFRCAWGYRLTAAPGVECEVDGQWSGPVPSCEGEVYTIIVVTSDISAKSGIYAFTVFTSHVSGNGELYTVIVFKSHVSG